MAFIINGLRDQADVHRAIAAKLRAHPALPAVARENLRRWSAQGGRSQPCLDTWRAVLDQPLNKALEGIAEDSPRMTNLRQSSTPWASHFDPHKCPACAMV